jgi:hypothetical protein
VRLLVLGDRNPDHLTHREIDAALALMPDGVERAWVPTDSPRARVLERSGVTIAASAPDAGVEAIELREHPFFVATAFQPQVGASEAEQLDPLIGAFFDAAAVCAPTRAG